MTDNCVAMHNAGRADARRYRLYDPTNPWRSAWSVVASVGPRVSDDLLAAYVRGVAEGLREK